MSWHLFRVEYRTDAIPGDEVPARMSGTIPDRAFDGSSRIVDVDWDRDPGWVWVTFLRPGDGFRAVGGTPDA